MTKLFSPRCILPVHYDLPKITADPGEITDLVEATVLGAKGWHEFHGKELVV